MKTETQFTYTQLDPASVLLEGLMEHTLLKCLWSDDYIVMKYPVCGSPKVCRFHRAQEDCGDYTLVIVFQICTVLSDTARNPIHCIVYLAAERG